LNEIKDLLRLCGQGRPPCDRVRELARANLRDIDSKIRELATLRTELQQLLRRRSSSPRIGEICPIIQREA
jgi:DNA-binding transcriptional MerR regulator